MAREWQQTRFKDYMMPDAVYYQTIWAVRDLERMEERLKELSKEIKEGNKGNSIVLDNRKKYSPARPTEGRAVEKAILEERISGIRCALNMVPQDCRCYVMSNIVLKNSGKAFPNNFWRVWKQKFLYNVAKNLSLM